MCAQEVCGNSGNIVNLIVRIKFIIWALGLHVFWGWPCYCLFYPVCGAQWMVRQTWSEMVPAMWLQHLDIPSSWNISIHSFKMYIQQGQSKQQARGGQMYSKRSVKTNKLMVGIDTHTHAQCSYIVWGLLRLTPISTSEFQALPTLDIQLCGVRSRVINEHLPR